MTDHHVLIVGAGAAGSAAATELRNVGFNGPLTIVNGEAVHPYNRTTVNKTLLQPDADLGKVRQPVPDDDRTHLLTGTAATSLETEDRCVRLQDGSTVAYDSVLVASGAIPRTLGVPVQGAISHRVITLRTAHDAARIRAVLAAVQSHSGRPARVIIAGASLLGSETAEALTALGARVQLLDPSPTPLGRLFGPVIGGWVRDQHRIHLGGVLEDRVEYVEAVTEEEQVAARLVSGTTITADLLIAAIGVEADTRWLTETSLYSPDGIVTDDRLRAVAAGGVYAAGDVARVAGRREGEHWGQALGQGAHAARVIAHDLGLGVDPGPFVGSFSYATRLYGKPVSVIGSTDGDGGGVGLVYEPAAGVHVTAFVTTDATLNGLVYLGPMKIANKLRPLVGGQASLGDAADVVRGLGLKPIADLISHA